jgi:hypothetical protein
MRATSLHRNNRDLRHRHPVRCVERADKTGSDQGAQRASPFSLREKGRDEGRTFRRRCRMRARSFPSR